jgi:hypothetical protein
MDMWDDRREVTLLIRRAFENYLRYRRRSRLGRLHPVHKDTLRRLALAYARLTRER